jgi:branched-subunit amino acid permease
MGVTRQIQAMVIKNFLLKRRHLSSTLGEFFAPIFMVMILIWGGNTYDEQ